MREDLVVIHEGQEVTDPSERRETIRKLVIRGQADIKSGIFEFTVFKLDNVIRYAEALVVALNTTSSSNNAGIQYSAKLAAKHHEIKMLMKKLTLGLYFVSENAFPSHHGVTMAPKFCGGDLRLLRKCYESYLASAGMGWFWRQFSQRFKQVRAAIQLCDLVAQSFTPSVQERLVSSFMEQGSSLHRLSRSDTSGR